MIMNHEYVECEYMKYVKQKVLLPELTAWLTWVLAA